MTVSLGKTTPAMPVGDMDAAIAFYRDRLGFEVPYAVRGFAVVRRDDAEVHLWHAGDRDWRDRDDFAEKPICSGAESFIAGTASCRIEVAGADELYEELRAQDVLHYADPGSPSDTDHGTREFAAVDLDGNLLSFYERR